MRKLLLVATLAVFSLGCSDNYGACVKAGADIASSVAQGYSTITQLEQQGTLSPAETLNIAGYLKFTNDADKTFLTCAQAAHTNATAGAFTVCATSFVTSLNTPQETALIHVGNASAQNTVNTIVNGFVTGIGTLKTALGGA